MPCLFCCTSLNLFYSARAITSHKSQQHPHDTTKNNSTQNTIAVRNNMATTPTATIRPTYPPQLPQAQAQAQGQAQTLEVTIISGKHLKNVNWKSGRLKPYAIFWVDPDNKLTTKSDDYSDTKPVWNQRFSIPIPPAHYAHTDTDTDTDPVFNLEVFHSRATETPKPFVGSLKVRVKDFHSTRAAGGGGGATGFDLLRPSGRPQGKIKLKLEIADHHNYYYSPPPPAPRLPSFQFFPSRLLPPSPPPLSAMTYPYSTGYYAGYYSPPGPPPPPPPQPSVMRSFSDRNMSYGAPSAPVDYSSYEPSSRAGSSAGPGFGTGFGVGAVTGVLGGLALDEGLKYEEEKVAERVEDNYLGTSSIKDDFSEYHADY